MNKLITAATLCSAVLVSACAGGGFGSVGGADTTGFNGNPGGSTPPAQPAPATALFHPASGQLPYPTDLYFAGSTDGTLNIQPRERADAEPGGHQRARRLSRPTR